MEITSRHHLRSDGVRELESSLADHFGITIDATQYELAELSGVDLDVVLVDGQPFVVYFNGEPAPTVRGANAFPATKRRVTVDAGAISFISDGADVMRPGIVEADKRIEPDDLVIIVEETHEKALAIGRARVDGENLRGDSGKVIDSLHHVGDELYDFSP